MRRPARLVGEQAEVGLDMLGPKKRQVGGCTGALLRSPLQAGRALRNACTEGTTPVVGTRRVLKTGCWPARVLGWGVHL
jgi:hypothetical protein